MGAGASSKNSHTSEDHPDPSSSAGAAAGADGAMGEGQQQKVSLGSRSRQSLVQLEDHYKKQLEKKDKRIAELEKQLESAAEKDAEIEDLKRKIDKLKSVLDQKIPFSGSQGQDALPIRKEVPKIEEPVDLSKGLDSPNVGLKNQQATALAKSQNSLNIAAGGAGEGRTKKVAVSGEKYDDEQDLQLKKVERFPKNDRVKKHLRSAIDQNTLLSHMDGDQLKELVDCMKEVVVKRGDNVISEGDPGDNFYIAAEGMLQVYKRNAAGSETKLGTLATGVVFGELAVLYNCTRTASVRALEDAKLWAIDRATFHFIMMKATISRKAEYLRFMENVEVLKGLPSNHKHKIADAFEEEGFEKGEYIIRQGDIGDTFYIISEGEVVVTIKDLHEPDGFKVVRTMGKGSFFGEKALLSEDSRTANVVAKERTVCVTLDRYSFNNLLGPLEDISKESYPDLEERNRMRSGSLSQIKPARKNEEQEFYENMKFDDLELVATLGCGGFGRVELVKYKHTGQTYAMKCLQKAHIVATRQQDHVFAEKKVMMSLSHPFITRLYRTFKDPRFLYMLMEVSLGGEMWTILRDRGSFDEKTARFYVACVVVAFEYLHKLGIIYRDLKPENLLIDAEGYVKVVDFGFAKRIGIGKKTWTFCGTPEYVAPEIVLNKGHDFAADYWSLGVLIYELLTGRPPFMASDHMQTYNMIVAGIDKLEIPKKVGKNATNLLKKLCRESPSERLGNLKDGIKDIKKHKWFQGFDWAGLQAKRLTPPIIPTIKAVDDVSNFDQYPPSQEQPPVDESGWDDSF